MEELSRKILTGERALFQGRHLCLSECVFEDGESPLKESEDIQLKDCLFRWKYPLWYSEHISLNNCTLFDMARAGIWYTKDISLKDCRIEAPKSFRRASNIRLENVVFSDAKETLWNCSGIFMKHVTVKGDYFAMNCSEAEIDDFQLIGNYGFDGAKNIVVRNAKMLTKDAFWNCENVVVYDSFISGEYFGWNSSNVTLVNCTVESLQGMCYMKNIVMKNCRLIHTTLSFEYSTVDAEIEGKIDSVKNPLSGRIRCEEIGELIMEDDKINAAETKIVRYGEKKDEV